MEKILTPITEFCEVYSVSRSTLYAEVRQGRLRITKRGRRSFIHRDDAADWVGNLRDGAGQ